MGAWGLMECKAGHGNVSGYRGMLVDARGRCALAVVVRYMASMTSELQCN